MTKGRTTESQPDVPRQVRIERLHRWYCDSVLDIKLLPEVQRLWNEFFRQEFNGPDLALVIRYLRRQIGIGKRNEGALKLTNLFERAEDGSFVKFAEDLALAKQWERGSKPKLTPLPDGEAQTTAFIGEPQPQADAPRISEETKRRHIAALDEFLGRKP